MVIELKMHPNCSEWDSEVESDDTDYYNYRQEKETKIKDEVIKALKGWDG